jgi:hypothetical protein
MGNLPSDFCNPADEATQVCTTMSTTSSCADITVGIISTSRPEVPQLQVAGNSLNYIGYFNFNNRASQAIIYNKSFQPTCKGSTACQKDTTPEFKTCACKMIVGRTLSLHYYYLAFVVLTYVTYLIAVNTSYISSLGTTDPGIQVLIALDWLFGESEKHSLYPSIHQ